MGKNDGIGYSIVPISTMDFALQVPNIDGSDLPFLQQFSIWLRDDNNNDTIYPIMPCSTDRTDFIFGAGNLQHIPVDVEMYCPMFNNNNFIIGEQMLGY